MMSLEELADRLDGKHPQWPAMSTGPAPWAAPSISDRRPFIGAVLLPMAP
jgi:hypothetical protein